MAFEWDETKRRANLDKHGIDFVDAKEIWQGAVVEFPSAQARPGEHRSIALGVIEGRIIAVVYTWRNRRRRLISARSARKNEKAIYQTAVGRRS